MIQFIKDLLTGKDGESYDVHRVSILLGVVVLVGTVAYSMVRVEKIALVDVGTLLNNFGIALGSILGGGGLGLMAKAKTEPDA